jgi:hypothetical protein
MLTNISAATLMFGGENPTPHALYLADSCAALLLLRIVAVRYCGSASGVADPDARIKGEPLTPQVLRGDSGKTPLVRPGKLPSTTRYIRGSGSARASDGRTEN